MALSSANLVLTVFARQRRALGADRLRALLVRCELALYVNHIAFEQRGDNFQGVKDLYLKAKARIWSRVSFLRRFQSRGLGADRLSTLGVRRELALHVHSTAFEQRTNNFKGSKDLYLKTKARI